MPNESLSLEDMLAKMGPFQEEILGFVHNVEASHWFSNVGKDLSLLQRKDDCIIQVFSWEEATRSSKAFDTENYQQIIARQIGSIAKTYGIEKYIDSAIKYWNKVSKLDNLPLGMRKAAFFYDQSMVIAEIITKKYHDIFMFRDRWYWYSQGHWSCSTHPDGTQIVF
jgi:hypothetical protein